MLWYMILEEIWYEIWFIWLWFNMMRYKITNLSTAAQLIKISHRHMNQDRVDSRRKTNLITESPYSVFRVSKLSTTINLQAWIILVELYYCNNDDILKIQSNNLIYDICYMIYDIWYHDIWYMRYMVQI